MGIRNGLFSGKAKRPIAVHFGNDGVIRMMRLQGMDDQTMQASFEVSEGDQIGLSEAVTCFRSRNTVVSVPSSQVLLTHIRVDCDTTDEEVVERLCSGNDVWKNASIRQLPIFTNLRTGIKSKLQQELLCVGVPKKVLEQCVLTLEDASLRVQKITVPIHATLRAFDRLYRREGDGSITSIVVDLDQKQTIAMIAHGMNLVVASSLKYTSDASEKGKWEVSPVLVPVGGTGDEFERRGETQPRGLIQPKQKQSPTLIREDDLLLDELQGCMRHHNSLFPERVIDRIVFSGSGALHTQRCASVATKLGLSGFIADPSAWISGAEGIASGPVWTTVAGLCLTCSGQSR